MLRLAAPVLCCAVVLWLDTDAPTPRRAGVLRHDNLAHLRNDLVALPEPVPPGSDQVAPASSDEGEPERPELRQHDVRDLLALGFTIEHLAGLVRRECGETATRLVNVLELRAPVEMQMRVQCLLDATRRDPCVRHIWPVEDLVAELRDREPDSEMDASEWRDALVEVVHATVDDIVSIRSVGDNLVVLAQPRALFQVEDYLNELRENCGLPRRRCW